MLRFFKRGPGLLSPNERDVVDRWAQISSDPARFQLHVDGLRKVVRVAQHCRWGIFDTRSPARIFPATEGLDADVSVIAFKALFDGRRNLIVGSSSDGAPSTLTSSRPIWNVRSVAIEASRNLSIFQAERQPFALPAAIPPEIQSHARRTGAPITSLGEITQTQIEDIEWCLEAKLPDELRIFLTNCGAIECGGFSVITTGIELWMFPDQTITIPLMGVDSARVFLFLHYPLERGGLGVRNQITQESFDFGEDFAGALKALFRESDLDC